MPKSKTGCGKISTFIVSIASQPVNALTLTQYVPLLVIVNVSSVELSFHKYVKLSPWAFALKTTASFVQIEKSSPKFIIGDSPKPTFISLLAVQEYWSVTVRLYVPAWLNQMLSEKVLLLQW